MSDDLAAKAASWVPPWQRPADEASADEASSGEPEASAGGIETSGAEAAEASGAEAAEASGSEALGGEPEASSGDAAEGGDEGPASGSGVPGQWDRLSGAKWQTAHPAESADDVALDEEPQDQDRSDPQLSDCVSEDDADLDIEEAGSWNARDRAEESGAGLRSGQSGDGAESGDGVRSRDGAESGDGVRSRDGAESGDGVRSRDGAESGDGAEDADGPEAELSGDGFAGGVSEDERVAAVLSGDDGDDGHGAGALSGDEPSAGALSGDGPDVALLSGESGGRSGGGKRSRPKRSAGAEAQPDAQSEDAGAAAGLFAQGQLFVPAQRVGEDRPSVSEAELVPALEAILMVVDEPVGEMLLAQVLDVPAERVADALLRLSAAYTEEGKGFDLRRAAGGWRFYTRAEYSAYVERFVLDGQQLRLTQASLETLAVVAYKQPVTRSRISAIRGVNCDGVCRTLVTRGLIEECGTEPESGAHLYKTTNLFLEKLGLDSVEQLPPLAPFLPDNLDEVALNE